MSKEEFGSSRVRGRHGRIVIIPSRSIDLQPSENGDAPCNLEDLARKEQELADYMRQTRFPTVKKGARRRI